MRLMAGRIQVRMSWFPGFSRLEVLRPFQGTIAIFKGVDQLVLELESFSELRVV